MALRPETVAAVRAAVDPWVADDLVEALMESLTPVLERAADELKASMTEGFMKIMLVTLDEMINARRSTARAYGVPPRVVEIEVAAWDMVRQVLIQHGKGSDGDDKQPESKGPAGGQWQQHGG